MFVGKQFFVIQETYPKEVERNKGEGEMVANEV